MYKFCLLCLLCFLTSCCSTRDNINKEMLDSIYEINIQNRALHRFGGIEEINIKDKKEIASICKELISLKEENNLQTRPFEGTILIRFLKKDQYGMGEYINSLTTGIILKPNSEYYIDFSTGQYVSDHFLARILKYLEIDESKVPALDAYRKKQLEKPARETKQIDKE
jgi:hypothetical protein